MKTEMPSVQSSLHESIALSELLDRAEVGIAQVDTDGRYVLVNDCYCKMLGCTRQDLLGELIQDSIHPEDLPETLVALIQVIETGTAVVIEHRHSRPDGSSVWISNNVSVGRDAVGNVQYVLVIAQDITSRKRAERALDRTKADLRLLLDSAADGFYCIDRDGTITLCNAAFLRMLSFERQEDVIGRDFREAVYRLHSGIHSDNQDSHPVLKTARYGTHVHVASDNFSRRDGKIFPVEYWARPIIRTGEIQGAVCTFVDITERKKAEARQELLNRELAHRVKNTLSMVQAIVGQTLRGSPLAKDIVQSVNKRLAALGHAHNILTRTQWSNASIVEIVEGAITAHRSEYHRIQISGPRIDLGSRAALGITMALHELCTNAVKYGALSNMHGIVHLDWSITGGAADALFHLTWREQGGPPVTQPKHRGFGSKLITDVIQHDLRGKVALIFDPEGVVWTLEAPLSAVID